MAEQSADYVRPRPRLLDLFCGAGGAAMGYHLAGYDVIGVDIAPQPDYPFEFHQANAMTFPLEGFDAYHASPPCQAYSPLRALHPTRDYPALYEAIRARLDATGKPWVIENVIGAPYRNGLVLCGSMFGMPIRRHRNFESSHLMLAPTCRHSEQPVLVGVYGASDGAYPPYFKHPGKKRGPRQVTTIEAREVMGMPWVRRREGLTQAIPPAFTEWIGERLIAQFDGKGRTDG